MTFQSILFENPEDTVREETLDAPPFFVDLNLDQVVEAITAGRQFYNLKPFFHRALGSLAAIQYRHQVFQDLENPTLFRYIEEFTHAMGRMRDRLTRANKLYYQYQKERWFLDAVKLYCRAIQDLDQRLKAIDLHARGLLAFRQYLTEYVDSDHFVTLVAEADGLLADLSKVKYSVLIHGNAVKVRLPDSEVDYSTDVEATFQKFQQGAVKNYLVKLSDYAEMNHVEEQILYGVATLYPELFARLDRFCTGHADYLDETIHVFDREIQFYVAYLDYVASFKRAGLSFNYPRMSNPSKEVYAHESFDLALATKLRSEHSAVVCNDFYLKGPERIIVVSGPNQGGKTTFARMFGQLHYLASLGCPVPGREAQLFLFDRLFTHFEREENIQDLRGKLEDDLVRIHAILEQATSSSVIIMNEIFTSTTLQDALFLGKEVMRRLIQLDALCVFVTFIDELASLSEKTVSMVSTVIPENPALRTFRIVRKPADGLAYALAVAEKHHVTYQDIKERINA